MDNIVILIVTGFLLGTLGTLIGAGGGFILVPLLLLAHPNLSPELVTAVSMAVVCCNAISGSVAYMRSGRVDYKAGLTFALFTLPGSILGVITTKYVPRHLFDVVFGAILVILAIFLFTKGGKEKTSTTSTETGKGIVERTITDRSGETYNYRYNIRKGSILSLVVGYLSPLLGIGGGIIHVPAMSEWLMFPVHIATATSHFVLAIMSLTSVMVHIYNGNYNDPMIQKMVIGLGVGVIAGAQLGAYLSARLKGKAIIKALAISLGLVGIRILLMKH